MYLFNREEFIKGLSIEVMDAGDAFEDVCDIADECRWEAMHRKMWLQKRIFNVVMAAGEAIDDAPVEDDMEGAIKAILCEAIAQEAWSRVLYSKGNFYPSGMTITYKETKKRKTVSAGARKEQGK